MAMETGTTLFHQVFRTYGLPEDIVLDRGPHLMSRVWKAFCTLLGINVSLSSGYHLQSKRQTKRLNQEIGQYLRLYCSREQQHWSKFLLWVEYAQNSLTHPSTGLTPFQCILGYQLPLFLWSGEPSNMLAVVKTGSITTGRSGTVPMFICRGPQRGSGSRQTTHIPGYSPFPIVRQVKPVTYRLQLPPSYPISPTFHVSLLKPACPCQDDTPPSNEPPPPPDIDGTLAYRVDTILNSWHHRNRLQYLVDWEGYGPEERSCVDADDKEFHHLHPG
ncbi:hypothetical protein QTP86_025905 [Hemibagrus guttatus]|nr:hypothetical protein QTP86_025905 [Hemibagrus guttatus]